MKSEGSTNPNNIQPFKFSNTLRYHTDMPIDEHADIQDLPKLMVNTNLFSKVQEQKGQVVSSFYGRSGHLLSEDRMFYRIACDSK